MPETSYDPLRHLPGTFEAWMPWLFDRLVIRDEYWFWDGDYHRASIAPAKRTLDYSIRLFGDAGFLRQTYSAEQIDQGLWRLLQFLSTWLDSDALDLQRRIQVVELVPALYRDLLGHIQCQNCHTSYMWWDVLRFVAGEGLQPATAPLTDAMRAAMVAMLKSGSVPTARAAIHGLAHLMIGAGDTGARDALESYRRQLGGEGDQELLEEVQQALTGDFL